jgi:hypothetical protein
MGLVKASGAQPAIAGAEALARFMEWRWRFEGLNNADSIGALNGYSRFAQSAGYGTMFRVVSGLTPTYLIADSRRTALIDSSGAASSNLAFRPFLNAPFPVDCRFGPLSPVVGSPSPPTFGFATSIMAWIRKAAAGDATHCNTCLGFADFQVTGGLGTSATVSRCGLVGDGGLGFRFGSVNCPDGNLAGANAANAIDINSIQPDELINPGANWFHVRIKMIPPTLQTPGRWCAYLNGRLIKVFDQFANIPRGSGSLATGNHAYTQVEAALMQIGDASNLPGFLVEDVRVWLEENYEAAV